MAAPAYVKIVEVGPRDGLQNESPTVPVDTRVALIDLLSASGLPVIEAGAFVSRAYIPQMEHSNQVLSRIVRREGVQYPVLVPNMRGYENARAAGAQAIAVFTAASETFSKKNVNCSIDETFARFAPVLEAAKADGVRVRGYISCVLVCPYEGNIPPQKVAEVADRLFAMGCAEISLGDTIGAGTPPQVETMVDAVARRVPLGDLAVHFHDTYGRALLNTYTALEMGIAIVDASVAGLGGCPYALGASGNLATEDVVSLLRSCGTHTGVNLDKLVDVAVFITAALGRPLHSKAGRAVLAKRTSSC